MPNSNTYKATFISLTKEDGEILPILVYVYDFKRNDVIQDRITFRTSYPSTLDQLIQDQINFYKDPDDKDAALIDARAAIDYALENPPSGDWVAPENR